MTQLLTQVSRRLAEMSPEHAATPSGPILGFWHLFWQRVRILEGVGYGLESKNVTRKTGVQIRSWTSKSNQTLYKYLRLFSGFPFVDPK